jgi:hypothetical protein
MPLHEEHRLPSGKDGFVRLLAWEAGSLWRAGVTCWATLENNDPLLTWQE